MFCRARRKKPTLEIKWSWKKKEDLFWSWRMSKVFEVILKLLWFFQIFYGWLKLLWVFMLHFYGQPPSQNHTSRKKQFFQRKWLIDKKSSCVQKSANQFRIKLLAQKTRTFHIVYKLERDLSGIKKFSLLVYQTSQSTMKLRCKTRVRTAVKTQREKSENKQFKIVIISINHISGVCLVVVLSNFSSAAFFFNTHETKTEKAFSNFSVITSQSSQQLKIYFPCQAKNERKTWEDIWWDFNLFQGMHGVERGKSCGEIDHYFVVQVKGNRRRSLRYVNHRE